MTDSLPSAFTTTCPFCNSVSSVTLTGAHDDLDVLCAVCGTYLGDVGTLKQDNAEATAAEEAAANAQEGG